MREVVRMRASQKRNRPSIVYGERAMKIFEASIRARANKLLAPSARFRSFEQIYEMLASLRSSEARDLRKTLANYFSFK